MQLFSAEQLKEWDDYTIRNTPISSLDLMEKASAACFNWIKLNGFLHKPAYVFCGKGNNGGDGLAIARMISRENQPVVVFIIETGSGGTPAFQANLERLRQTEAEIHFIRSARQLPVISADAYIIDALFGTGLNRPLEGVYREITEFINRSDRPVISIDLPSGMMTSSSSKGCPVVKARVTLTVQSVKLPFLFRENQEYVGQIVVLDCGLHPDYPEKTPTQLELIESEWIDQLIKPRRPFAHKGDYGHAALFAGSPGMAGAAILAARACMRSGVGKLTCYVPEPLIPILQIGCPEAMCRLYQPSRSEKPTGSEKLTGSEKPTGWVKSSEELSALARYSAIGVGPGWGTSEQSRITLENLLRNYDSPLVIDADALNLISLYPQLSKHIPLNSILTPHPAEFERFAGKSDNDYKRIERALEIARDWQVIIILKGHHSFIATPGGKGYFNITGNPGMATAGSGDVLTGILTGLLAQGYSPLETAIAGVYLHGRAGDLAAEQRGMASLIASDIVENLRIGIR